MEPAPCMNSMASNCESLFPAQPKGSAMLLYTMAKKCLVCSSLNSVRYLLCKVLAWLCLLHRLGMSNVDQLCMLHRPCPIPKGLVTAAFPLKRNNAAVHRSSWLSWLLFFTNPKPLILNPKLQTLNPKLCSAVSLQASLRVGTPGMLRGTLCALLCCWGYSTRSTRISRGGMLCRLRGVGNTQQHTKATHSQDISGNTPCTRPDAWKFREGNASSQHRTKACPTARTVETQAHS